GEPAQRHLVDGGANPLDAAVAEEELANPRVPAAEPLAPHRVATGPPGPGGVPGRLWEVGHGRDVVRPLGQRGPDPGDPAGVRGPYAEVDRPVANLQPPEHPLWDVLLPGEERVARPVGDGRDVRVAGDDARGGVEATGGHGPVGINGEADL